MNTEASKGIFEEPEQKHKLKTGKKWLAIILVLSVAFSLMFYLLSGNRAVWSRVENRGQNVFLKKDRKNIDVGVLDSNTNTQSWWREIFGKARYEF